MIFVALPSVPLYLKFLNIVSLIASVTFFIAMIINSVSNPEQDAVMLFILLGNLQNTMSKMVAQ